LWNKFKTWQEQMNCSNLIDSKIKSPKCIDLYLPRNNGYSPGKFTKGRISVCKARLKFHMKWDCEPSTAYPCTLNHYSAPRPLKVDYLVCDVRDCSLISFFTVPHPLFLQEFMTHYQITLFQYRQFSTYKHLTDENQK